MLGGWGGGGGVQSTPHRRRAAKENPTIYSDILNRGERISPLRAPIGVAFGKKKLQDLWFTLDFQRGIYDFCSFCFGSVQMISFCTFWSLPLDSKCGKVSVDNRPQRTFSPDGSANPLLLIPGTIDLSLYDIS